MQCLCWLTTRSSPFARAAKHGVARLNKLNWLLLTGCRVACVVFIWLVLPEIGIQHVSAQQEDDNGPASRVPEADAVDFSRLIGREYSLVKHSEIRQIRDRCTGRLVFPYVTFVPPGGFDKQRGASDQLELLVPIDPKRSPLAVAEELGRRPDAERLRESIRNISDFTAISKRRGDAPQPARGASAKLTEASGEAAGLRQMLVSQPGFLLAETIVPGSGRGMDQKWYKPGASVEPTASVDEAISAKDTELCVHEVKGKGARLGVDNDGLRQMAPEWVADRARRELNGHETRENAGQQVEGRSPAATFCRRILDVMVEGESGVVRGKVTRVTTLDVPSDVGKRARFAARTTDTPELSKSALDRDKKLRLSEQQKSVGQKRKQREEQRDAREERAAKRLREKPAPEGP